MPHCDSCEGVFGRFDIESGADFSALLRVLKAKLRESTLIEDPFLVTGPRKALQGPFSDVADGTVWPDDMDYFFRCLSCRQAFRLRVRFLEGEGGAWDVYDERKAVAFEGLHP